MNVVLIIRQDFPTSRFRYHGLGTVTGAIFRLTKDRSQIALALRHRRPLYLHIRNAYEDFVTILHEELLRYGNHLSWNSLAPPCIVHCFTGSFAELEVYVSYGWYIGLTGSIMTLSDADLSSLLQTIPPDRLVIETDSPYMGWKGCRVSQVSKKTAKYPNIPASLPLILQRIVQRYNGKYTYEELAHLTVENSFRFWKLDTP